MFGAGPGREPDNGLKRRAGTTTRARPFVVLAALVSTTAVGATVWWSRRWDVSTIAVLLAASWGAVVALVDALLCRSRRRTFPAAGTSRDLTVVVRLTDEQLDVARTSLVLAAEAGPVTVVATRHDPVLDELGELGIREYVAPTMADALDAAIADVATDAVLMLSASAFPLRHACELAAAELTDGVGWVTARASAFNNDRYAPEERELIGARARERGRAAGLVTWEPDATVVRTSLLREHPMLPGRPYGSWLRDRAAEGWRGVSVPLTLARQAAPADAPLFWPMQARRRRGAVADLADALAAGTFRARWCAFGGLLRELFAYAFALWLLAFVLIGRGGSFPFAVSPLLFFAMHGCAATTRWISSRIAYGLGVHPVDEARAAAYDVPGSLSALPSALTRGACCPLAFPCPISRSWLPPSCSR